jgi:hypothetical protein
MLEPMSGTDNRFRVVTTAVDHQEVGARWPELVLGEEGLTAQTVELGHRCDHGVSARQIAQRHGATIDGVRSGLDVDVDRGRRSSRPCSSSDRLPPTAVGDRVCNQLRRAPMSEAVGVTTFQAREATHSSVLFNRCPHAFHIRSRVDPPCRSYTLDTHALSSLADATGGDETDRRRVSIRGRLVEQRRTGEVSRSSRIRSPRSKPVRPD